MSGDSFGSDIASTPGCFVAARECARVSRGVASAARDAIADNYGQRRQPAAGGGRRPTAHGFLSSPIADKSGQKRTTAANNGKSRYATDTGGKQRTPARRLSVIADNAGKARRTKPGRIAARFRWRVYLRDRGGPHLQNNAETFAEARDALRPIFAAPVHWTLKFVAAAVALGEGQRASLRELESVTGWAEPVLRDALSTACRAGLLHVVSERGPDGSPVIGMGAPWANPMAAEKQTL